MQILKGQAVIVNLQRLQLVLRDHTAAVVQANWRKLPVSCMIVLGLAYYTQYRCLFLLSLCHVLIKIAGVDVLAILRVVIDLLLALRLVDACRDNRLLVLKRYVCIASVHHEWNHKSLLFIADARCFLRAGLSFIFEGRGDVIRILLNRRFLNVLVNRYYQIVSHFLPLVNGCIVNQFVFVVGGCDKGTEDDRHWRWRRCLAVRGARWTHRVDILLLHLLLVEL